MMELVALFDTTTAFLEPLVGLARLLNIETELKKLLEETVIELVTLFDTVIEFPELLDDIIMETS